MIINHCLQEIIRIKLYNILKRNKIQIYLKKMRRIILLPIKIKKPILKCLINQNQIVLKNKVSSLNNLTNQQSIQYKIYQDLIIFQFKNLKIIKTKSLKIQSSRTKSKPQRNCSLKIYLNKDLNLFYSKDLGLDSLNFPDLTKLILSQNQLTQITQCEILF